jgi:hypothetical protein
MPKYYRRSSGIVTRYWVVETYYFQTASDRETFFGWIKGQEQGKVDDVEMDGCSITVRWNR